MNTAPLRVLVTRAAEQAGNLVARLEAIGCEVIEIPLISVVAPDDGGIRLRAAIAEAGRLAASYEWIVLTSPNAATRSLSLLDPAASVRIAAIGPGTAAVCEDLGFTVSLVPQRSVGEGLVDVFPEVPVDGSGRVLFPCAEAARDVVPTGLRAKGWLVDVVIAYRTVERVPGDAELLAAQRADAVLCASSSAARSLVRAFGMRLPKWVVSIGPETTRTLEGMGVDVAVTADPHTLDGLVAAVEAVVAMRRDVVP